MEPTLSIAEKIVCLRGVEIFAELSVAELTAIASVTEEVAHPAGALLTQEGQFEDALHLIVGGNVIIEQAQTGDSGRTAELTRFGPGEALGLSALFGEPLPSILVRTAEATQLLRLHRDEFEAIAREYPEVPLHICRVLSQRLNLAVARLQEGPPPGGKT